MELPEFLQVVKDSLDVSSYTQDVQVLDNKTVLVTAGPEGTQTQKYLLTISPVKEETE